MKEIGSWSQLTEQDRRRGCLRNHPTHRQPAPKATAPGGRDFSIANEVAYRAKKVTGRDQRRKSRQDQGQGVLIRVQRRMDGSGLTFEGAGTRVRVHVHE